jgi:hypothetical protein
VVEVVVGLSITTRVSDTVVWESVLVYEPNLQKYIPDAVVWESVTYSTNLATAISDSVTTG